MLSQSLNLSVGFGGMISLAHAGFYGVGATLPTAILLSRLLALTVPAIASRFIALPNSIAANMRQIIYGGILIFMMFRYSRGFGYRV